MIMIWGPKDAGAQFLMDMVDTTKEMGKGVLSMYKRFDHIRISGYIQPQFQVASAQGAEGYSGGNFQEFSNKSVKGSWKWERYCVMWWMSRITKKGWH